MINRHDFELEKEIVDWFVQNGLDWKSAVAVVSYAELTDKSVLSAYMRLTAPVKNEKDIQESLHQKDEKQS